MNPLKGSGYSFWSGIGNDLPIWLFGVLPLWWQHHNCHAKGCLRLGKYPFQHFKLCRHHHPQVPKKLTHLHIAKLHKSAKLKK